MPASWLSRLSIGKKLTLSFSVIFILLIGSLGASFFYLSRVNSYVERHQRITIPAVVTASEMLRNLSDMQTHMHHLLDHQNNAEQTISLKAIADLERRTLATLDTYQAVHAVRTHPVLYGMLQQHGQGDLADQESQTIVAIADGMSALRAQREDLGVIGQLLFNQSRGWGHRSSGWGRFSRLDGRRRCMYTGAFVARSRTGRHARRLVLMRLNVFQHILLGHAPSLPAAADLPNIQVVLGYQPCDHR